MKPADAVAIGLDELAAAVTRMRDVVAGGGVVDLAGLDAEASRLCEAATSLPSAQAKPLLARFEGLLEALAALETEVRRTGLGDPDQNDPASLRRMASSAYGRTREPGEG
jgi:hypothetical protein